MGTKIINAPILSSGSGDGSSSLMDLSSQFQQGINRLGITGDADDSPQPESEKYDQILARNLLKGITVEEEELLEEERRNLTNQLNPGYGTPGTGPRLQQETTTDKQWSLAKEQQGWLNKHYGQFAN